MSRSSSVAASAFPLILGAALAAVAFGAEGGTELTRTTVTGALMVLVSGVVIGAAFLWGRAGAIHGMTTLLLLVVPVESVLAPPPVQAQDAQSIVGRSSRVYRSLASLSAERAK